MTQSSQHGNERVESIRGQLARAAHPTRVQDDSAKTLRDMDALLEEHENSSSKDSLVSGMSALNVTDKQILAAPESERVEASGPVETTAQVEVGVMGD